MGEIYETPEVNDKNFLALLALIKEQYKVVVPKTPPMQGETKDPSCCGATH